MNRMAEGGGASSEGGSGGGASSEEGSGGGIRTGDPRADIAIKAAEGWLKFLKKVVKFIFLVIIAVLIYVFATSFTGGALDSYGFGGARAGGKTLLGGPLEGVSIGIQKGMSDLKEIWFNPAGWNEGKEAETEVVTKTGVGVGIKVKNDEADGTGIISPLPRSGQEYTILVGIKNPTKDFVGVDSKLSLGNADNISTKTGLKFDTNPFVWDDGTSTTTLEPKGYKDYIIGAATSKNSAKTVASLEEVGKTNTIMEVDYTHSFKPTAPTIADTTGTIYTYIVMYQVPIMVGTPGICPTEAQKAIIGKDKVAGGPVKVTRKVIEQCLYPNGNINLIYTIQNADSNSGVLEAIEFNPINLIYILVPTYLTKVSSNLVCDATTITFLGENVRSCQIKDLTQSNIAALQKDACSADGCLFNNYKDFTGKTLLDTSIEPMGATLTFHVDPAIPKGKVYNIYLIFFEGAYKYHAAITKLISVQQT